MGAGRGHQKSEIGDQRSEDRGHCSKLKLGKSTLRSRAVHPPQYCYGGRATEDGQKAI
jgi:hypothetical protein